MKDLTLPPLPEDYEQRMPRHEEQESLVSAGNDCFGRPALLTLEAMNSWNAMRIAANAEGHCLWIVSAFRSYADQEKILKRKLLRDIPWDDILRVSAFPGFSEHHTGRAIDIGTVGFTDLTESFEKTPEFQWLQEHASNFGFSLSYPRDNQRGILYEPWHWFHKL